MIKKLLILVAFFFAGMQAMQADDWKVVGQMCGWSPADAIPMNAEADGTCTITFDELDAAFKFIAGDDWSAPMLGVAKAISLNGNCELDLTEVGEIVEVEETLYNVTLTLDPEAKKLKVSGLAQDQHATIPDIYLRGTITGWDAPEEYKMTFEGDGRYSLKVDNLSGEFLFANNNWSERYAAGPVSDITGNCTVSVSDHNLASNFTAPNNLENVEILLDTQAMTVTFSGLPNNQFVPEYDPNVAKYGYFISTSAFHSFGQMIADGVGIWKYYMWNVSAGEKFYISTATLKDEVPEEDLKSAIQKYLYGSANGNLNLYYGTEIPLIHPADSFESACFELSEEGTYELVLDVNSNTLTAKKIESGLYICGDVVSENGVENGFLAPSATNLEVYNKEFMLHKIESGNVYTGCYKLTDRKQGDGIDGLPQFRFFTQLIGWKRDASLGAAEPDFYCEPVWLEDGYAESQIIWQGLGNWGIDAPGQWINITADLDKMVVSFSLVDAGADTLIDDAAEGNTIWFNTQGIRVERPGKGIFIKVSGEKVEKVNL